MLENIIIITIVVQWCWFLYVLLQQKKVNRQVDERIKDIVRETNINFELAQDDVRELGLMIIKARKDQKKKHVSAKKRTSK